MNVPTGWRSLRAVGAAALGIICFVAAANAEERKLSVSGTLTGTSDYVFRGISQRLERPALQGSVDASYGIFYIGAWGSGIDFVPGSSNGPGSGDASLEVDFYAGITPKWHRFKFDFGVIYYWYPNAEDQGLGDFDYVELKAGTSVDIIDKLSAGVTYYYSPEFFGEVGQAHAIEVSASYEFREIHKITPSISAAWGTQLFDDLNDSDYQYWNAGLGLAAGNVSLDFRYWDTDISGGLGGLADSRFVFTASVSVP